MKLKLTMLTAGAFFFLGQELYAQQQESPEEIEEVVVVGYVKKPIGEITGSASVVTSDQINSPTALSVDQALQGKVAGVVINTSSGTPGSFQDIRIRGVGSLTASNAPLFVIDGVPMVNEDKSAAVGLSTLSSLASINNEDIESITVLKDAASTAIYGARGANGVIVINTKRGKEGKTKFGVNTSIGFSNEAYNKLKMLTGDQRFELLREALSNQLGISLDEAEKQIYDNDLGHVSLWDGENHDWTRLTANKNARTYNLDINASGGDAVQKFYASLGYNKTESIVISDPFQRITGNFSYVRKMTDKLKWDLNINGSWLTQNPLREGNTYLSNPIISRFLLSPWIRPYNDDGSFNTEDFGAMTSLHNTLYTYAHNIFRNKQLRAIANTGLEYKVIPSVTFSTRLNIDFMFNDYKRFDNRIHGDGLDTNGRAVRNNIQNFNLTSVSQINYTHRWDKHRLDASVFYEYIKNQRDFLEGWGENFPSDGLSNLDSASANYQVYGNFLDWKNISYFSAINYSFANKYILDATIRREGSSRFAPRKRFGTFWSVGVGWNVQREKFLPEAINELKLRASYGLTGNNGVGLNAYQTTLLYNAAYDLNGGAYPGNFGNPDLTWERSKTVDGGIDFALFKSRISGSFDYFNKKSYDLLQNVPLSRTTGFTLQAQNVGSIRNTGVEVALRGDVFRSNDFNLELFASAATLKNKVLKLATSVDGKPIDVYAGDVFRKAEEGRPFMSWNLRTWAGVNPQTGAPEWYLNGVDGEKTSNYNEAARVFHGSAIPKITGGFGTNISYKNVFLNANFYYASGHKIYEQYTNRYMRTFNYTFEINNGSNRLMDRWQQPGDITDVPKLDYNKDNHFQDPSTRFLFKGDYIRLKDLVLGYNLPADFVHDLKLSSFSLTLRGTNLWTHVADKNLKFDPETNATGLQGVTTPPVRTFMVGASIQF